MEVVAVRVHEGAEATRGSVGDRPEPFDARATQLGFDRIEVINVEVEDRPVGFRARIADVIASVDDQEEATDVDRPISLMVWRPARPGTRHGVP